MDRSDILNHKEEILQWITENKSKAFISKQLHCKPTTLNNYLKKMNIEYVGQQGWRKGVEDEQRYIPAEEYIKKERVACTVLRKKLIKENIKPNCCEICGALDWLGIELQLELHHKDGNHYNNNFDNLQILCPNCHTIQDMLIGSKTGRYTENFVKEKIKNNYTPHCCIDCGKPISSNATRCPDCYHKSTRVDGYGNEYTIINKQRKTEITISREELKNLIRTVSFLEIGRQFHVSDNAIRKWCKGFNLPSTKKEIKSYSDEEWKLV